MVLGSLFYQTAIIRAEEWFWNQGWFCNQNRMILKPKPMILQPRMILKPKKMILKPRMIPKPRTPGNQNGMVQQWSGVHFCFFRSIVLAVSSRYMPIWRRCHVECGRKCVRGRNAAARTLLSHPTPPGIWRRCYVDCGRNCDADVGFWVVRMVVGEWPFFGCEILFGIAFFWLRNRLFLVAEAPFLVAEACLILVAESPKFGCGSVEIWFRNRNLFDN